MPYHSPKYCQQQKPPPPPPPIQLEDGEQAWNIQEILDLRIYHKKIKYLVNWEGYTHDDDTWEPIENLDNAQECLEEFHRKYPNKPSHDHINVCAVDSSREKLLFDPNTNMPGTHFISPPKEIPWDIIITLPSHIISDIYNGDVSIIERGWPFNPPLPHTYDVYGSTNRTD
jgi:hypothetical protein